MNGIPRITGRKYPIILASTAMTELILLSSTKSVTPMHTMTAQPNQSLFDNLGNFINNYLDKVNSLIIGEITAH